MRQARRFVESLIRQRRPRPFAATPEDAAEIRAAIELRAGAPGAGEPSEAFVTGLRRQLELEMSTLDPKPPASNRRRVIVRTTSIAAASAAIGAGAGLTLSRSGGTGPPAAETLTPSAGAWRPVVDSTSLPDGAIQPFDVGTMVGFVHRANGELRAVSGICTHLGCRLRLNLPDRRLDCPCHRTSFLPTGEVRAHQLPVSPPPLPHVPVRESNGVIEILAPVEPP